MGGRRLAAILAADIAGYSALMGKSDVNTVADLKGHQSVVLPMISGFSGRIIDTAGDGILAEFASVFNAVKCAIAIQEVMLERNASIPPERRMQFRIGINQGDVLFDEDRIYGDGINIAARLEGLCEPGGLCISGKVYEEIKGRFEIRYQDIGEQSLKNISDPIRTYRISVSGTASDDRAGRTAKSPPLAAWTAGGAGLAVVLAVVAGWWVFGASRSEIPMTRAPTAPAQAEGKVDKSEPSTAVAPSATEPSRPADLKAARERPEPEQRPSATPSSPPANPPSEPPASSTTTTSTTTSTNNTRVAAAEAAPVAPAPPVTPTACVTGQTLIEGKCVAHIVDESALRALAGKLSIPLPQRIAFAPLDPATPAQFREYYGAWGGNSRWNGAGRQVMVIVTNIDASGSAAGIYAQGPPVPKGASQRPADFLLFNGSIGEEGLKYETFGGRFKFEFKIRQGGYVAGKYVGQFKHIKGLSYGTITLERMP